MEEGWGEGLLLVPKLSLHNFLDSYKIGHVFDVLRFAFLGLRG